MKIRFATTMAAVVLAGVAVLPPDVAARRKPSELDRSRWCRAATAKNSRLMISYDLAALDRCHHRSARGEQTGDCNVLADAALAQTACPFTTVPGGDAIQIKEACRGVLRATAGITASFACQATSPVLQNYPPSAAEGGVALATNVLGPAFLSTVGTSGAALQATPAGSAAPSTKAERRCRVAIGRVRSKIVNRVVAAATACQKKIDQRSTAFTAIDPSCLAKAGGSFGDETSRLRKACRSVAGPDVGSCADLPGCVRDSAIATGQSLARTIYGGPTVCGNGVVELGEACDDGNADNTDACTTTCTPAACGDGFVQAGVEECDDGNRLTNDSCSNTCKVPACGDGVVNGDEECDDGNNDPNDGCANCRNALTCSSGGITATLQLIDAPQPVFPTYVAAVRVDLGYPAGLSIPGAGLETDDTRFTNLVSGAEPTTGVFDRDDNGDGIDDTLRIVYALAGGRSLTEQFGEVQFDCTQGTPLRLDSFNCVVLDAADLIGATLGPTNPNNPLDVFTCKVVSLR